MLAPLYNVMKTTSKVTKFLFIHTGLHCRAHHGMESVVIVIIITVEAIHPQQSQRRF